MTGTLLNKGVDVETKKCSKCGEVKSLYEFGRPNALLGNPSPWCKSCHAVFCEAIFQRREKEKNEMKQNKGPTSKMIYDFLADSPGSSAETIAAHFGCLPNVARTIARRCGKADNCRTPVRVEFADGVERFYAEAEKTVQPDQPPDELPAVSAIVAQLIRAIGLQVRRQINAELDDMINAEVEEALSTVSSRVMSRLSMGQIRDEPVAPAPAPRQITAQTLGLVKAPVAAAVEPVIFSGPMGNAPVTNVLSTKTKARLRSSPEEIVAEVDKDARRPRVLIIGIHDNKRAMIVNEFKPCLEIRTLNPDQYAQIKGAMRSDQTVLVWADFIGHKHTDVLSANNIEHTMVRGGMSSLRDALTNIYVQDVAA